MEYTTNATGATGWTAIPAAKWVFNGPGTTLLSGHGNPLGGSKAFSGFSNGWTFSKADLTSLHGKKIFVRFRYGNSKHRTATTAGSWTTCASTRASPTPRIRPWASPRWI